MEKMRSGNFPSFHAQMGENSRLRGAQKEPWTEESIPQEYVGRTRMMIDKIKEMQSNEAAPLGEVVYLDKSARPVSWLVDEFWDEFGGGEQPSRKYLAIDRMDWFSKMYGLSGLHDTTGQGVLPDGTRVHLKSEHFDIDQISESDIMRIRALFVKDKLNPENMQEVEEPSQMNSANKAWNLTREAMDEIRAAETGLDGKSILVVDEVKSGGATLWIAEKLLERALPEAVVEGVYFWNNRAAAITMRDGTVDWQMKSMPVWYNAEDAYGRMIGDPSPRYYDTLYEQRPSDKTLKQKIGRFVLGAPHYKQNSEHFRTDDPGIYIGDQKAIRLRDDIRKLRLARELDGLGARIERMSGLELREFEGGGVVGTKGEVELVGLSKEDVEELPVEVIKRIELYKKSLKDYARKEKEWAKFSAMIETGEDRSESIANKRFNRMRGMEVERSFQGRLKEWFADGGYDVEFDADVGKKGEVVVSRRVQGFEVKEKSDLSPQLSTLLARYNEVLDRYNGVEDNHS